MKSATYNDNIEKVLEKVKGFLKQLIDIYGIKIGYQNHAKKVKVDVIEFGNIYPISASVELTYMCNLRCKHCYGNYGTNAQYMSIENAIHLLEDLNAMGIKNIELTGGDISVYKGIEKIIEKATKLNFNYIILLTNGINLSEELKQILIKNKEKIAIQIDVHSLREEYLEWFTEKKHYLSKVIENVKFFSDNGLKMRIVTTVTKKNLDEIENIADFVAELNNKLVTYSVSPVVMLGRAEAKETDLYLDDIKLVEKFLHSINAIKEKYPSLIRADIPNGRENCGCLTTQVTISPLGNIKLCPMANKQIVLGNVFTESIKNIFDKNQDFIKEFLTWKAPGNKNSLCSNCDNLNYCTSCFVRAFELNKKYENPCKWYINIPQIIKEKIQI